jgi:hypothetical protein
VLHEPRHKLRKRTCIPETKVDASGVVDFGNERLLASLNRGTGKHEGHKVSTGEVTPRILCALVFALVDLGARRLGLSPRADVVAGIWIPG